MKVLPLSKKGKGEQTGHLQSPRSGICLAVLGIFLMTFGAYRGEISVVLEKAVNICMECIGIG